MHLIFWSNCTGTESQPAPILHDRVARLSPAAGSLGKSKGSILNAFPQGSLRIGHYSLGPSARQVGLMVRDREFLFRNKRKFDSASASILPSHNVPRVPTSAAALPAGSPCTPLRPR